MSTIFIWIVNVYIFFNVYNIFFNIIMKFKFEEQLTCRIRNVCRTWTSLDQQHMLTGRNRWEQVPPDTSSLSVTRKRYMGNIRQKMDISGTAFKRAWEDSNIGISSVRPSASISRFLPPLRPRFSSLFLDLGVTLNSILPLSNLPTPLKVLKVDFIEDVHPKPRTFRKS